MFWVILKGFQDKSEGF